jgi:adenosylcobinamide-GDP ribazoletransferase
MLSHAVSRALLVAVMHLEPPARSDGLAALAGRPSSTTTLWALGIGGVIAVVFAGFDGLVASAIGAGVAWIISRLARQQIGGITGDALGTVQQATAVAMLFALVALD